MRLRSLTAALVCASALSLLQAQSTGTATIVGTITDSTGALVPNAKVTARNIDTSFLYESTTTTEGAYYLPNLRSGSYELKVEANGFKTVVRSGIVLRVSESPRFRPATPSFVPWPLASSGACAPPTCGPRASRCSS